MRIFSTAYNEIYFLFYDSCADRQHTSSDPPPCTPDVLVATVAEVVLVGWLARLRDSVISLPG